MSGCTTTARPKECFVPGTQLKKALDYTSAQLGIRIKGRGTKTWAAVFKSGVICADRVMLGVHKDKVDMVGVLCSATGKPGGAQVLRRFPLIHDWGGTVTFMILNDMITEDIFRLHLEKSGQFCGLGRYAPRNGGHHGRFQVAGLVWDDEVLAAAAE